MVVRKIQRDATTANGFLRRTKEAAFEKVDDPRKQSHITHRLEGVLELGVIGLATNTSSTRGVEKRSAQLDEEVQEAIELDGPISDNGFGLLFRRLEPTNLVKCLHRCVRSEWIAREKLRPTHLSKSTVAIDGKHLASLSERRLRGLVEAETDLDSEALSVEQLREVMATRFPDIQIRDCDEGLDGLVRAHRATLISHQAAVVIDQCSIPGKTNEEGQIVQTLRSIFGVYGRTKMVGRVTVDAGNATKEAAAETQSHGADYLFAIKSPQGAIYDQAVKRLGGRKGREADFHHCEETNGQTVTHTVWRAPLGDNCHGWAGASQLIRVERVTVDNDGKTTVGNRYFLASEPSWQLTGKEAYRLARAHWRCENEGHWTADAIWHEDAKRTPWTSHPTGILNVGILRVIAINILALLRSMSRLRVGDTFVTPTWRDVIEHAIFALLEPILETQEFDAFVN